MLTRILRIKDQLTSAERRVADWVLEHPNQIIDGTLADIASATTVSEPTVVRFCRSVGTSGFRDFKTRLTQHLAVAEHVIHADVSPHDDAQEIIAKVMGRSINELIGVRQRLNAEVVEQLVEALASVTRIDLYGIGASGFVVTDAQNKFFRLGIPCNAYSDSPTIMQAASITHSDYAVILVSKTGASQPVIDAAKTAVSQGARVFAITSPASALADVVEQSLLVDVDEDTDLYTPMSSRLAQLAILDAVQVATALRLGESGRRSLDKTKRILNS
ncbi:MAG: MurR/RpiR family transcriptional regulator [Gammaproteobacteria bacterium]